MSIKEFISQNKAKVIGGVVAAGLALFGTFSAGQQNPPPEVVVEEAVALRSSLSAGELTVSEQGQLQEALGDLLTFSCPTGKAQVQVDGGTLVMDCIFDEPTPLPTVTIAASVTFAPTLTSPASVTNTPLPFTPTKTATLAPSPTACTGSRCPTATKTPTPTKSPTVTPTPVGVTSTPDIGQTELPTNVPPTAIPPDGVIMADDGCEAKNEYHPVMVGVICSQYHTGADMRDPANQALFDTFAYPGLVNEILDKYGELWQPLFVSSPMEIPHHHRGFKWLIDINKDCDQFEGGVQDFSGWACIPYSASRMHDDGTVEHGLTRQHSAFFIWTVCGKGSDGVWQQSDISPANCAVFYGPQLMDFCDHHLSYKKEWNPIPGTDSPFYSYPSMPPNILNGGCYKTTVKEDRDKPIIGGWWGQQTEAADAYAYPHDPNAGFGITWLSNMWSLYNPPVLNLPIEDQKAYARTLQPDEFGGNWSFKIMNLRMQFEVPGAGTYWVDAYGHVKVGCTVITDTCRPLVVVGNPPLTPNGLTRHANLARRFDFGEDCLEYYCVTYATPGTEVYPYFDNPTGAAVEHQH